MRGGHAQRARPTRSGAQTLRPGFTLLEVLLVTIVSLTWPSALRYLREEEIRSGAEATRTAAASTRIKAIDTGLTYQLRYEPEGRRFVIIPYDPPETIAASSTPADGGIHTFPVLSGQLGEECRFVTPQDGLPVAEAIPVESFVNLPDAAELAGTSWGPPILFFPDGTAVDAVLAIVNDDELRIELMVRGLTGGIRVSPVMQEGGS
jgi:hypothetical protein